MTRKSFLASLFAPVVAVLAPTAAKNFILAVPSVPFTTKRTWSIARSARELQRDYNSHFSMLAESIGSEHKIGSTIHVRRPMRFKLGGVYQPEAIPDTWTPLIPPAQQD